MHAWWASVSNFRASFMGPNGAGVAIGKAPTVAGAVGGIMEFTGVAF